MGKPGIFPPARWSTASVPAPTVSKVSNPTVTLCSKRVNDYWGDDLPIRKGTYNFDEIRYDSYRDSTVMLEAFKGDQFDWRSENVAKNWATQYNNPAVREGKIVKETFPDKGSGVMQAFVPNLRREKFQDERVRRALNLAFDFESTHRTAFYDQYKRIDSYFAGTELAQSGLPQGKELEILESVRELIRKRSLPRSTRIRSAAVRSRCAQICARPTAF